MWDLLSYAAWSVATILLVWILVDAFRVSNQYEEELLMSSREGVDELDPE